MTKAKHIPDPPRKRTSRKEIAMGYALIWIEALATALFLVALVTAGAARLRWRSLQILFPVAAAVIILGLGVATAAAAWNIYYGMLLSHNWVAYTFSWTAAVGIGMGLVMWKGLRRVEGQSPAATAWPPLWIAIGLLAAAGAYIMTSWNMDLAARVSVAALRTEAGARALALAPPRIVDRDNAALVYEKAFNTMDKGDALPKEWSETWSNLADDPQKPGFDADSAPLRAFMKRQEPAIAFLRRAAAMPDCSFERNWAAPGFDMLLPELSDLRQAARLLVVDARLKAADGKPREALENVAAVFAMAQHTQHEPIVISALVAMSIDTAGSEGLESVLAACRPSADDLKVLAIDDSLSFQHIMPRVFQMEEAFGLSAFPMVSEGDMGMHALGLNVESFLVPLLPVWRVYLLPDEIFSYRNVMGEFRSLAARPYYQTHIEWKRTEARLFENHRMGILTKMLVPALGRCMEVAAKADARHRLAAIAVAATSYRLKTGRLPARLEDLVPEFMPAVPVDPFDGKPMKMAAAPGGGMVIYSVGADFKDDGGKVWDDDNRTGDITFHLGAK
jgi:hypothetical protein